MRAGAKYPESKLTDTPPFDATLVDLGFGPYEGGGALVVGLDEGSDVVSQLFDGGEGRAGEALSLKDRERNGDLGKPGRSGRGRRERAVRMARCPRTHRLA